MGAGGAAAPPTRRRNICVSPCAFARGIRYLGPERSRRNAARHDFSPCAWRRATWRSQDGAETLKHDGPAPNPKTVAIFGTKVRLRGLLGGEMQDVLAPGDRRGARL